MKLKNSDAHATVQTFRNLPRLEAGKGKVREELEELVATRE
jgi:hypothetical protein